MVTENTMMHPIINTPRLKRKFKCQFLETFSSQQNQIFSFLIKHEINLKSSM